MNVEKINELTNIAQALRNLDGADHGTLNRVVELIGKELDAAEPNAQAEDLKALQASNNIKQANLNLLASKVLDLFGTIDSTRGATQEQIHDLQMLARGLYQEEQNTNEVAYNQRCDQGGAPVDPVAQVVANLKSARAEVLRLVELRKQTSNADEEVSESYAKARAHVSQLQDTLIKVIDGSLK